MLTAVLLLTVDEVSEECPACLAAIVIAALTLAMLSMVLSCFDLGGLALKLRSWQKTE
jgi:hypothetical protein